jgi:hypothetical protein
MECTTCFIPHLIQFLAGGPAQLLDRFSGFLSELCGRFRYCL